MNPNTQTIVIFDTKCVLCIGWVRFLLRYERRNSLKFASSQKAVGIHLAAEYGMKASDLELTYLVIQNGKALTKSRASLALVEELRAPWRYLGVLRFVPRGFLDWSYDAVARNRLKWFGERQDCLMPSDAQRSKFLDEI
ncbi:MAG: thiol-disulfide oxidoreductase DCC family protein [Oceanococcus sp.]